MSEGELVATNPSNIIRLSFLGVLFAAACVAQERGTIVGTVSDPSGAAIPGITVTLAEADTGFRRTAVTDAKGDFVAPSMRPTRYHISVEARDSKSPCRKESVCRPTRA